MDNLNVLEGIQPVEWLMQGYPIRMQGSSY